MTELAQLKEELVTANRILAHHHVVDSFGHISVRHPTNPNHFLMSRARAPGVVVEDDIMEFTLDGKIIGAEPGKPYSERFIHGAILEARPDQMAVVHNHSPNVVPFTVTGRKMRPIMHMCAPIGGDIPNWDISTKFGNDTNLLVTNMEMGRDLAKTLGPRTVSLMRGHGSVVVGRSIREVVFTSIYMEANAEMLIKALQLGGGEVHYLHDGEIAANTKGRAGFTWERGWENWCREVDRKYVAQTWDMGPGFSKTDPAG
ncbi:MAG: class II aldolase/adducin family protein [Beijerinckiaceae bacterium]|jgi:ribulose-5-phosphate 4-epimerase/fuculose-1-phosphate aldolase|nr:class II aldolase/adducin family protein [Beijerinckiaceae bacterium]MDO9439872.1 class II aldolase/adducin family protein [Beijerinckiaceae bacterium]